jgi:hypothetical protein
MSDPRDPIFDFLRPHLKEGWNFPGGVEQMHRHLDLLGARKAGEQPPLNTPVPIVFTGKAGFADQAAEDRFFAELRNTTLFPRGLVQSQVEGIKAKIVAYAAANWPVSYAACGMATSYWETGKTMQPVREKGSGDGPDADKWDDYLERYDTGPLAIRLGNTPEADGDGVATAGKGDVQLTGVRNYRVATEKLRERGIIGPEIDLVKNPELVLRPDLSAAIMVLGMEEGWFTGKKLADYLPGKGPATFEQLKQTRRIINGVDHWVEIANAAMLWQQCFVAGGWK